MSLFQSLNQAPFHLDHWVAIIVSGRCRSHSSWMLGQVTHTWPFSRPKPESIFPFSFSFSSPCCRDVEGAPALRSLCPANSRRVFSDRADEMKKKALDCLEAFFHSVCARACRARSSKPGQNVPWECRGRFFNLFPHGSRLLPAWSRQRCHGWKVGMWIKQTQWARRGLSPQLHCWLSSFVFSLLQSR